MDEKSGDNNTNGTKPHTGKKKSSVRAQGKKAVLMQVGHAHGSGNNINIDGLSDFVVGRKSGGNSKNRKHRKRRKRSHHDNASSESEDNEKNNNVNDNGNDNDNNNNANEQIEGQLQLTNVHERENVDNGLSPQLSHQILPALNENEPLTNLDANSNINDNVRINARNLQFEPIRARKEGLFSGLNDRGNEYSARTSDNNNYNSNKLYAIELAKAKRCPVVKAALTSQCDSNYDNPQRATMLLEEAGETMNACLDIVRLLLSEQEEKLRVSGRNSKTDARRRRRRHPNGDVNVRLGNGGSGDNNNNSSNTRNGRLNMNDNFENENKLSFSNDGYCTPTMHNDPKFLGSSVGGRPRARTQSSSNQLYGSNSSRKSHVGRYDDARPYRPMSVNRGLSHYGGKKKRKLYGMAMQAAKRRKTNEHLLNRGQLYQLKDDYNTNWQISENRGDIIDDRFDIRSQSQGSSKSTITTSKYVETNINGNKSSRFSHSRRKKNNKHKFGDNLKQNNKMNGYNLNDFNDLRNSNGNAIRYQSDLQSMSRKSNKNVRNISSFDNANNCEKHLNSRESIYDGDVIIDDDDDGDELSHYNNYDNNHNGSRGGNRGNRGSRGSSDGSGRSSRNGRNGRNERNGKRESKGNKQVRNESAFDDCLSNSESIDDGNDNDNIDDDGTELSNSNNYDDNHNGGGSGGSERREDRSVITATNSRILKDERNERNGKRKSAAREKFGNSDIGIDDYENVQLSNVNGDFEDDNHYNGNLNKSDKSDDDGFDMSDVSDFDVDDSNIDWQVKERDEIARNEIEKLTMEILNEK